MLLSDKKPENSHQPQRSFLPPPPWSTKSTPGPWDTIVIGSGMGGLATASILAQTGDKVLVLEQHYEAGGFTHTFRRKNNEWDIGIHYLGKARNQGSFMTNMAGLTGEALSFSTWSNPVDVIRYPGIEVHMPGRYSEYKEVLGDLFPKERDGISKYLDTIRRAREMIRNYFALNIFPVSIARFARRYVIPTSHYYATSTTTEIMNLYLRDEHLKDILDAQWGNIGRSRKDCSFLCHAAMLGSFLEDGASFPDGGSSIIARKIGTLLQKHNSVIRTKARVKGILTKDDKAIGVILENGEHIEAKKVVSGIGAKETYNILLKEYQGHKKIRTRTEIINACESSYPMLNLFLGFDTDPENIGILPANYWYHSKWQQQEHDQHSILWDLHEDPLPKVIFFSHTTHRDALHNQSNRTGHNAQAITIGLQEGTFKNWENTKWNKRPQEYLDLKAHVQESIIESLNNMIPGMKDHIKKSELATPITYKHYTDHIDGIPYGLAAVTSRYKLTTLLGPRTPIKNLYLTGQDLIMPGIPAALGAAVLCASQIRRRNMGTYLRNKGKKILSS